MGKSGRAIRFPKGGVNKPKLRETEATRQKAERDTTNSLWGNQRCEEIVQANNPVRVDPEGSELPNLDNYANEDIGDDEDLIHEVHDENEPPEHQLVPLNLTQLITGDTYKEQRLRDDANWKEIMQPIFIAFMQASQRTSRWGNDALWSHDYNAEEPCSCVPRLKRSREVDTVDLICKLTIPSIFIKITEVLPLNPVRRKITVEFCACTSDQVRLIRLGYLGGTAKSPETAFSLRLLRFYHISWKYCHSNLHPFALMIDEYLDAFNPLILVEGTQEVILSHSLIRF